VQIEKAIVSKRIQAVVFGRVCHSGEFSPENHIATEPIRFLSICQHSLAVPELIRRRFSTSPDESGVSHGLSRMRISLIFIYFKKGLVYYSR
jgi:hypothetical protein